MSIAVAGSTAGAYDLQYFTTDHLGSVRVVTGGSGNVVFSSGYMPYGTGTNTAGSAMNEFRFSGKEVQPQAGLLDFGARLYDPRSASWLSPDPKSEKYYSVSPYAYCANDTLDLVDPEGEVPHVVIGDSSSAVSKSIRKEVASEFRDAGKKISGPSTKKALNKEVSNRINTLSSFEKSSVSVFIETVETAHDDALEWGTGELILWLNEKKQ